MARSTKLPLEPPPEVIIPEERLQHMLHKSFEPKKQVVGYNVRLVLNAIPDKLP